MSQSLRDVWAWKKAVNDEVRHLPTKEALAAILDRAGEVGAAARREAELKTVLRTSDRRIPAGDA